MANASLAAARTVKTGAFGDKYLSAPEKLRNYGRWDTWHIGAGATLASEYLFFQTPVERAGSGFTRNKTYAETNMTTAGALAAGEEGSVERMYIVFTPVGEEKLSSNMAEYIQALSYDSLMQVQVNDSDVLGSRHAAHFGGYGISGYLDQSNPADIALINPASSSLIKPYLFRTPFGIPSDTRFTVKLRPNSNNTFIQTVPDGGDFDVTVYLMGTFTTIAVN